MNENLKCPGCGGWIAPRIAGRKGRDGRYERYWQCLRCRSITTDPWQPDCRIIPTPVDDLVVAVALLRRCRAGHAGDDAGLAAEIDALLASYPSPAGPPEEPGNL